MPEPKDKLDTSVNGPEDPQPGIPGFRRRRLGAWGLAALRGGGTAAAKQDLQGGAGKGHGHGCGPAEADAAQLA